MITYNKKKDYKLRRFATESIDNKSGEITVTNKIYSIPANKELFSMTRHTEGLNWIDSFKSIREYKLILKMLEFENNITNSIILNKEILTILANEINCSIKSISNTLSSLYARDIVRRVSRNSYVVNPSMIYIGGTKELEKKIAYFNKLTPKN